MERQSRSYIRPKSAEHLEVQVGEFVAQAPFFLHEQLTGRVGEIAAGDTNQSYEYTKVDYTSRGGTSRVTADYVTYLAGLKRRSGVEREFTERKTALAERFHNFAPHLEGLPELARTAEWGEYGDIPGYLGNGAYSVAVEFEHEGELYVARLPHRAKDMQTLDKHLIGALLTEDIPGVEKIVAASYTEDITIAERAPGVPMYYMTRELAMHVTDEQIVSLMNTCETVRARGVSLDTTPGNLLYDPTHGFTMIDYAGYTVFTESDEYPTDVVYYLRSASAEQGWKDHCETALLLLQQLQRVAEQTVPHSEQSEEFYTVLHNTINRYKYDVGLIDANERLYDEV